MTYDIPSLLDGYAPFITPQTAPDMAKLRETVARKLDAERAPAKKPKHTGRTLLIAAAAAALLCVGALAAALGGFDWLRDEVEPEFIGAVEPVERSVTDNGIRFSVIAAGKFDESAIVYFSLTDIEGKGRVNEDSMIVMSGYLTFGSANMIYFDDETQMAVYEAKFNTLESIGVDSIYNNVHSIGSVRIDADLSDAYLNGERVGEEEFTNYQTMPQEWLTAGYVAGIPGVDGAYVSAIGDNGRMLAVQFCWPLRQDGNVDYSTVIDPYLVDAEGNRIDTCLSGAVTSPYYIEGMNTTEMYFKVDAETLEGCTLCFEGRTGDAVYGDWCLDADFSQCPGLRRVTADVEVGGYVSKDTVITISPIGLMIDWNYEDSIWKNAPEVILETTDGEISIEFRGGNWYTAHKAIDVDAVTAIRIGDTRIELE